MEAARKDEQDGGRAAKLISQVYLRAVLVFPVSRNVDPGMMLSQIDARGSAFWHRRAITTMILGGSMASAHSN
jgi:hypothetical protein